MQLITQSNNQRIKGNHLHYFYLNFYQFFLVQEINSFNNVNNSGAYKVYNNLNDFLG